MPTTIEILFAPAEFACLNQRDLSDTLCVVFDVLRATTSMVTALGNGAAAIIPVSEISEALSLRQTNPDILLAGEREGVRIESHLTGGPAFDLGNSPREFTRQTVQGRTIAITTTNGTRALRACANAKTVLLGTFLNLGATAEFIKRQDPVHLLLVCSGTFDQTAYEDVLAAGALCELIWSIASLGQVADSAQIARQLFHLEEKNLSDALTRSRNGRRLMAQPRLRQDVAFCAQRDVLSQVAQMGQNGMVTSTAS